MSSLLFSPALYWIPSGRHSVGEAYQQNVIEYVGDLLVWLGRVGLRFLWHVFPFLVLFHLAGFLGDRDYREITRGGQNLLYVGGVLLVGAVLGTFLRALGRAMSSDYMEFMEVFDRTTEDWSSENKKKLSRYDFDFSAWPEEFFAYDAQEKCCRGSLVYVDNPNQSFEFVLSSLMVAWFFISVSKIGEEDLGSYNYSAQIAMHAVRLAGPAVGFVWLIICKLVIFVVYQGTWWTRTHSEPRCELIQRRGGQRFKLMTEDGNHVDSMFFDRRGSGSPGEFLVIVCEGNCCFYECGNNRTPTSLGFSVLAWNHPGFCGSSGVPYPSQETHAADCVMLFALSSLKFHPERIIVFGWSIGGFTATWLAMNYPNIYGLILDSTFDSLDAVAVYHCTMFPDFIVRAISNYVAYLDVAKQLNCFDGPVRIIRRTRDEVMSADTLASNRTNYLLVRMLSYRYPSLVGDSKASDELKSFLSGREDYKKSIMARYGVSDKSMSSWVGQDSRARSFPSGLGRGLDSNMKTRLLLFLASIYMLDFPASHCVKLPESYFSLPTLLTG